MHGLCLRVNKSKDRISDIMYQQSELTVTLADPLPGPSPSRGGGGGGGGREQEVHHILFPQTQKVQRCIQNTCICHLAAKLLAGLYRSLEQLQKENTALQSALLISTPLYKLAPSL